MWMSRCMYVHVHMCVGKVNCIYVHILMELLYLCMCECGKDSKFNVTERILIQNSVGDKRELRFLQINQLLVLFTYTSWIFNITCTSSSSSSSIVYILVFTKKQPLFFSLIHVCIHCLHFTKNITGKLYTCTWA